MELIYINLFCVALSSYVAGVMKDPLWKFVNLVAATINIITVASHLVPTV